MQALAERAGRHGVPALWFVIFVVAAAAGLGSVGCAKREAEKRPARAAAPTATAEADADVTKVPYDVWRAGAQQREMDCWQKHGDVECRVYREMSQWVMRRFYFQKDAFKDKVVVDIGCGPTGRLDWLEGSFIAIEPLATAYRELPYAHLEKYHKIYEQPAEERIDELVGKVDMIFSINCLDHAYDLEAIVANMSAYLKPGGRAFVSVDLDKPPEPTHPLGMRSETMRAVFLKHGLKIEREEQGNVAESDTGKVVPGRQSWGGGTAYHWWLRKAD